MKGEPTNDATWPLTFDFLETDRTVTQMWKDNARGNDILHENH